MTTPSISALIAGAIFDFAGYLTSRSEHLTLSSTNDAAPAVQAIQQWAALRALPLDDAAVETWRQEIAAAPAPQSVPEGWKPMACAPKTGLAVLVMLEASDTAHSARWENGGWVLTWDGTRVQPHDGPRYWMPIPDAPNASPAAPAEGAKQWTGIARAEQIADEASEDYVFEGDAGTYTPTDGERFMLLDFAMGLLADDEFISAIRAAPAAPAPADARPCTCHPDDNPPMPCARQYTLSECRKAAAPADVVEALPRIILTAAELREALGVIDPDNDPEASESELCIGHLADGPLGDDDSDKRGPGLFCWLADYPEEGVFLLRDESPEGIAETIAASRAALAAAAKDRS